MLCSDSVLHCLFPPYAFRLSSAAGDEPGMVRRALLSEDLLATCCPCCTPGGGDNRLIARSDTDRPMQLISVLESGPLFTSVLFFGWMVLPAASTDSCDPPRYLEGLSTSSSNVTCFPVLLPGGSKDVVGMDPGGEPPSMLRRITGALGLGGRPFFTGAGDGCLFSSSGDDSSITRSIEDGRTVILRGDLEKKVSNLTILFDFILPDWNEEITRVRIDKC